MKLIKKSYKAVDEEIKEEARDEAKKILKLATKAERKEFLHFHKQNQGNICCLILDKIKGRLMDGRILEYNAGDYFNHPFLDFL